MLMKDKTERQLQLEAEAAGWFSGKEFTADWVSGKLKRWDRYFLNFRTKELNVLEVGSFEGRSAIFFLNYFNNARLTCIDNFVAKTEARFDRNMAEYADRTTVIKTSAVVALDNLKDKKLAYDIIYLDAGKNRDHVLAMSLLTWPLLREGGMLIWDDYDWGEGKPAQQRPHDAIDIFLGLHLGEYEEIWKKGQVFIRRTA